MPFGSSSYGDQICLKLEGDDAGSVWLWVHDEEVEPEGDEIQRDNCYFCARSLREFLEGFFDWESQNPTLAYDPPHATMESGLRNRQADRAQARRMIGAQQGMSAKEMENLIKDQKLVWHAYKGEMQLVSERIHRATEHTGYSRRAKE
ncbi:MAG: HNH endonuclease [Thermoguttaceae bacterium]